MSLQIVIPMAGDGKRFQEAGYREPKPLIPVGGIPMVVRAVRDLPAAGRHIFLVRSEHIERFEIDKVLLRYFPGAQIIPVNGLTDGQATTVSLAAPALDPGQPVLVGACDNTHLYDSARLAAKMGDPGIASLIFTYRGEPRVALHPEQIGWVAAEGERVVRVSCKVPISHEPLGDHAISGCFYFREAGAMLRTIEAQRRSNFRVNNEFYVDTLPNVLLAEHQRVEIFEVEKYIGWGTPGDLRDYLRWQAYFEAQSAAGGAVKEPQPHVF